ncbi:hypothetical protein CBM2629_A60164 [Cupriavidus taiwanensis]|nr:hypothetical protein CBM2629_A60164 [Cupriavidus taiwanensis]
MRSSQSWRRSAIALRHDFVSTQIRCEILICVWLEASRRRQAKLNAIARRLNERPRKTLNFDTPAERFHQAVASTG